MHLYSTNLVLTFLGLPICRHHSQLECLDSYKHNNVYQQRFGLIFHIYHHFKRGIKLFIGTCSKLSRL